MHRLPSGLVAAVLTGTLALLGSSALAGSSAAAASTSPAAAQADSASHRGAAPDVSLLFSLTARSATLTSLGGGTYRMTVRLPQPRATWFADRPARLAGTLPLQRLVALWHGLFRTDPPNVALVDTSRRSSPDTIVAVLRAPRIARDGRTLSAVIDVVPPGRLTAGPFSDMRPRLHGAVPTQWRNVALFIDDVDGVAAVPLQNRPYINVFGD